MPALRIFVSGRVQGVFFREWTKQTATGLGLTGWVRNRNDGRVEILAVGPEQELRDLASQCGTGPPSARVDSVDVEGAAEEEFTAFSRRPTV